MALISLGSLEKIKILGFLDSDYKIPASVYVAMFNPTNFKEGLKINYETTKAMGKQDAVKYQSIDADEFSVSLKVDGTGTAQSGIGAPAPLVVQNNISLFKNAVTGGTTDAVNALLTVKESHEVPYLILQWGKFLYRCRCKSYSITYTLFDSTGLPIRADIEASFIKQANQGKLGAVTSFLSPDLTKMVIFKEGDTLPLLAQQEYGDSSLYLQVAQANNLTNFRNITPGTTLLFPPIDKSQQ